MAWSTVTVEGGLFPSDLLDQIGEGQGDGQQPQDFGLERGRLSDEIQSAFSDAQSYWDSYRRRIDRSAEDQHTGLTRNAWMIPFFGLLGYREGDIVFRRESTTVGGVDYAISHFAGTDDHAPPIHILGCQYELHRRPPQGRRSPHALVQEFLNRDEALWGVVTNGYRLRLLRDSQRMTRPTYLEFNLEGMITGSQYSEFALLFRIMHRTRFPRGADDAHTCFLERWFQQGIEQGGRVRDRLRDGVEAALEGLGRGFLQHRDSTALREQVASGRYAANDYYRELLKLIYRLLFLMVAEERRLLFTDESSDRQRIYDRYYSATQLRERVALPGRRARESERHSDLWQGLLTTFRLFRSDDLAEQLGLYALNGELFGDAACRRLEGARISNADLLEAVDRLARFDDGQMLRPVNYAALDVEELGSVYESLLDFEPVIDSASLDEPGMWGFRLTAGGGRKSSGSYYTPRELVQELIGSALVPVMEQRLQDAGRDTAKQEEALLSMTVIDPAAGSGHFLLAAARRIARELARVRTGEREPAPEAVRTAMRDVVPSCIYGVDKNEMAVDLCKVGLWIEGHAPGRPLSFLDHHIKHGDSLIGVYDLDVLKDGIPDGAYKALTGDDKAVAARMKKVNKQNRAGQLPMLAESIFSHDARALGLDFSDLRSLPDSTPRDVEEKAQIYESLHSQDTKWWDLKVACDLWTYAFFAPLTPDSWIPTSYDVRQAAQKSGANPKLEGDAIAASAEHPYFHWPLEFPDVFDEDVGGGGFDVVLGNPPWEQVQLDPREFFATRNPSIAEQPNMAARNRALAQLAVSNPLMHAEYEDALHQMQGVQAFIHESDRFEKTSYGRLNSAPLFAELSLAITASHGRAGIIVPSGIATDAFNQYFFAHLIEQRALVSLFDFENRAGIFADVHRSYKFCLLTLSGVLISNDESQFAFFLHQSDQLRNDERKFELTANDFVLFNPNTLTCPVFRTRRDADVAAKMYRRAGVFWREARDGRVELNPWGASFQLMFMMNSDSHLFRTKEQLKAEGWQLKDNNFVRGTERYLPLYEAKLFHQYDHRFATFDGADEGAMRRGKANEISGAEKSDPTTRIIPRYWVPEENINHKLDTGISNDHKTPNPEPRTPNPEARSPKPSQNWRASGSPGRHARHGPTNGDRSDGTGSGHRRYGSTHQGWSFSFRNIATPTNQRSSIASFVRRVAMNEGAPRVDLRSGPWFQVLRDVTNATNERATVSSAVPPSGAGHTAPIVDFDHWRAVASSLILANMNSFALDWAARLSIGGTHLSFFVVKQLPVLPPEHYLERLPSGGSTWAEVVLPRVLELSYTAWDLQPFAQDLGYNGPPFKWDVERRFEIRCELDAAYFHLYEIERGDVDYIMSTFPIVQRKDEAAHGTYRTRDRILDIYDAMASGEWVSALDPPAADPRAAHPAE